MVSALATFSFRVSETGTALHETKNTMSGSRRALIVTVIVVVALIVAVWVVIMTGALAFVLDPEVEGLRAAARLHATGW